jgi:hypothetical protein
MSSLAEIYQSVVHAEQAQLEKQAQVGGEQDLVKVAAHYDELGRAMARAYVSDIIKTALDESGEAAEEAAAEAPAEESEEEELARRKAEILAKLQAAQAAEGAGAAPEEAAMA